MPTAHDDPRSGHAQSEPIHVSLDGSASAAAVSVEPEAGSAQPDSPIVFVGTFRKP